MIAAMTGRQQASFTAVMMIVMIFFSLSPPLHAQEAMPLQRQITLTRYHGRLDTLFNRLATRTRLSFAYSPDRIDVSRRVSLPGGRRSLQAVLDDLARQAGFHYRLSGQRLLILPGNTTSRSGPSLFTLSGYVTDRASRERLPYASIRITGDHATTANGYGFFSLALPAGTYDLAFSYVGYHPRRLSLTLKKDTLVEVTMRAAEAPLAEVQIVHGSDDRITALARNGTVTINPSVIREMPAFLGEDDVMKSLQMVPGITFYGDGSTFFFVRGGNRDQNMILIDDAPVYNPSHMFGIFSSVTPEAVKSVRVYKGFFPASVGGRLSSLVDIRQRDGNMEHFGLEGSLGPATVRLTAQGPLAKEKSSFFLSARRSWFGWIPRAGDKDIRRLRFYDLNGRFNVMLNERNRLYLSFYNGDDLFRRQSGSASSSSGVTWGNLTGSMRWNHLFGKRLFLNTTLYGGSYDYDLVSSFEEDFRWHSHVGGFGIRSDLGWFRRPDDKIRAGITLSGHNFNPGNIYYRGNIAGGNFPLVPVSNAMGADIYLLREHSPLPRLTFNYGLRISSWFNMGSTWVYNYDENRVPVDSTWYGSGEIYHTSFSAEPRISVTWEAGAGNFLSAAYSLTSQYVNMLTNSITPFSSFEIWVPSGPNLKPQRAHQVEGGFFRSFADGVYTINTEIYFKKMTGQIDYTDHASLLLNPALEGDLRQGSSRAWGAEVLLRRQSGRLTGWLSYTYSRVWIHTPALNGGVAYPSAYDHPHRMTLSWIYHINEHWQGGGNMLFASGSPFSSPTAFFRYNNQTVPWYGSRNNDRLPPYFRIDLSVTWKMNAPERRYHHDLSLSIYNITARKNPYEYNYNKIVTSGNALAVPADFFIPASLVPTQMYLFRLIPAVTYHFKF